MLLVNTDPNVESLSIPTDDEDAPLLVERRPDGTFDVPFEEAQALLEWPHWQIAPAPVDPELDPADPAADTSGSDASNGAGGPGDLPVLKDLRKVDLQDLCLQRGLSTEGTNAELIGRLQQWAAERQA